MILFVLYKKKNKAKIIQLIFFFYRVELVYPDKKTGFGQKAIFQLFLTPTPLKIRVHLFLVENV